MRLMLAAALSILTAVSLAAIHPAVLTDAERAANLAIQHPRSVPTSASCRETSWRAALRGRRRMA